MNITAHAGLVQIHLNVPGLSYLLALRAAGDLFALLFDHADRQQVIAGNHLGPGPGRAGLDCFGNHSLSGIKPGHAVPGRRLVTEAL